MPTLDLALGLGVARARPNMFDFMVAEPFREIV